MLLHRKCMSCVSEEVALCIWHSEVPESLLMENEKMCSSSSFWDTTKAHNFLIKKKRFSSLVLFLKDNSYGYFWSLPEGHLLTVKPYISPEISKAVLPFNNYYPKGLARHCPPCVWTGLLLCSVIAKDLWPTFWVWFKFCITAWTSLGYLILNEQITLYLFPLNDEPCLLEYERV